MKKMRGYTPGGEKPHHRLISMPKKPNKGQSLAVPPSNSTPSHQISSGIIKVIII